MKLPGHGNTIRGNLKMGVILIGLVMAILEMPLCLAFTKPDLTVCGEVPFAKMVCDVAL